MQKYLPLTYSLEIESRDVNVEIIYGFGRESLNFIFRLFIGINLEQFSFATSRMEHEIYVATAADHVTSASEHKELSVRLFCRNVDGRMNMSCSMAVTVFKYA